MVALRQTRRSANQPKVYTMANSNSIRTDHPTLAAAIGAFVAGEMAASMADPTRMFLQGPDDLGVEADYAVDTFNLHSFEKHLCGLLSDLAYLCTWPVGVLDCADFEVATYEGTFTLIVVPADKCWSPETPWPDEVNVWQGCAQGFARIEVSK